MKEILTCAQCDKKWKRERSRGRKPLVCPRCLKAAQKAIQQPRRAVEVSEVRTFDKVKVRAQKISVQNSTKHIPQESDDNNITVAQIFQYYHPTDQKLKDETKGGSEWKCTKCGHTLSVKVAVSAVPTHKCSPNGRSFPMKRIS